MMGGRRGRPGGGCCSGRRVGGYNASERTHGGPRSPCLRGVLGGGANLPGKASLRLVRHTIREGWDILEDKRLALLEHLFAVAEANGRHPRNLLAACRCLLTADRVNLSGAQTAGSPAPSRGG